MKNKLDLKKINLNELCDTMLRIGKMILSSGGEANRVERTLKRLGLAYGCDKVDVMSIAHSIIITLHRGKETITEVRRVEDSKVDFYKLKKANGIYREVIEKPISLKEINKKIDLVKEADRINSFKHMLLSWCIISAFCTGFFGGNPIDMLFSSMISIVLCVVIRIFSYYDINYYFSLIIVSLLGGFLSKLTAFTGFQIHTSVINAGNIMPLIPGLTLTNSLRDMLSKDTITGMTEIVESVVISLIIATGFALTTFNIEVYNDPNIVLYLIFAFFSSVGYAMNFNQSFVEGLISCVVTVIACLILYILNHNYNMEILGNFMATIFITLMSEIFARNRKCPATVFLLQAILILVPGALLYRTMFHYVQGNSAVALRYGTKTLQTAAAIAFGILSTTAVVDAVVSKLKKH